MENQDIINNINAQIELLEKRYPDAIENTEHNVKIDYRGSIDMLKQAIRCIDICELGKTPSECRKTFHDCTCPSRFTDHCRYQQLPLKQALELF